ncbi:MAG: tRNA uridine-5-carboxymethylaminomethyl(34) synthesis enzyme MnmG [Candidatus Cryptobacteroides sp.]|nr:tRNA uridine-5-carboxymethylaminomethyl(34) synthesis enzyme MnmG [Candidatus Cryptobacteroides sp.]
MNTYSDSFDIIVIGGGHAGCEAAMAAANMGSKVLLISADLSTLAKMSCNPAVGGIAKGQIVREIDALGGYMGIVTDRSTLQFRMLNKSKGPAMWSPRAQCDKLQFSRTWYEILLSNSNLSIYADFAASFLFENSKIAAVKTITGAIFKCKAVILTAGTFLNGRLFIGSNDFEGGRIGEKSSYGISDQLKEAGIPTGRMKTGTPPRIDIRSVDLDSLPQQAGDEQPEKFSYLPEPSQIQKIGSQHPCYILHTNDEVHEILRSGFSQSPLFSGKITGIGPRYCPSIEDKLRTFPENHAHQLFLEPEGVGRYEYYLQGFSSSLPLQIQLDAMHKIKGLENAVIFKPAYAVEYDFFDPSYLKYSLESKVIENLFLAGQVNGTTGYEEAGAQGIIAGINAHLKVAEKDPFILGRDQAYIGVLIDDLITKGVDEPYRMFTSRAEYRILLRQDNADFRLTELSHKIGIADENRYRLTCEKYEAADSLRRFAADYKVKPAVINGYLESVSSAPLSESKRLEDIVSRPNVNLYDVLKIVPHGTFKENSSENFVREVADSVEISIKYDGYIRREKQLADKMLRLEHLRIPANFDFDHISGLTIECRQKLKKYKPETLAQASRISGVSPSDISIMLLYFGR